MENRILYCILTNSFHFIMERQAIGEAFQLLSGRRNSYRFNSYSFRIVKEF